VDVDSENRAVVAGYTDSREWEGFPVVIGPDLTRNGQRDTFVARVVEEGDRFVSSGYIGGQSFEIVRDMRLGPDDSVYVCGFTLSSEVSFPVLLGPDLSLAGENDGFIAKVAASWTQIEYCGYVGGTGDDSVSGVGKPDLPSDPAPSEVFQSKGLEAAITVVLQGFILDDDSAARSPRASRTRSSSG